MTDSMAKIATLTMEIEIEAPRTTVWKALVDNIGEWWPADFYAGGTDGDRDFKLEATPGGRMFEEWNGGGGALWGTVVSVDPENKLQVIGYLFPDWGGPSQWYGTWQLSDAGTKTKLTFSESSLGRVSDSGTEEKDAGWRFLWANLKAFVEGESAPEWPS